MKLKKYRHDIYILQWIYKISVRCVQCSRSRCACLGICEWMCPRCLVLCLLPWLHPHTASVPTQFTRSGEKPNSASHHDTILVTVNWAWRKYLIGWWGRPEDEPMREAPPVYRWLPGTIVGTRSDSQEEEREKKTTMHHCCFCSHAEWHCQLDSWLPWWTRDVYIPCPSTDKGIGSCFNYLQLASGSSIRFSEEKHRIYSSVTDSSGALVLAGKKKHISISVKRFGS